VAERGAAPHAADFGRLRAFLRGWNEGGIVPVGPPIVRGPLPARIGTVEIAALAEELGRGVVLAWRAEAIPGEPPPLEVSPVALWLIAAFHDLNSLALRPDPCALTDLGTFARSLPAATAIGDALAAHAFLRHARRVCSAWPDPVRAAHADLIERSPLTRFTDADLALARDWSGTDALIGLAPLRPWIVRALVPGRPESYRTAGAILAVLAEGRGFPVQREIVLAAYDAFFYHHREAIPLPDGRGERLHWPVFVELERLLASSDRAENAEGARRFSYFDPLLEIAAAAPAALEAYPNIARTALETLAALARGVARGTGAGLALAR